MPDESRGLDSFGTKKHRVNPCNPCQKFFFSSLSTSNIFLTRGAFSDTGFARFQFLPHEIHVCVSLCMSAANSIFTPCNSFTTAERMSLGFPSRVFNRAVILCWPCLCIKVIYLLMDVPHSPRILCSRRL